MSSLNFQALAVAGAGGVVRPGPTEPSLSIDLATDPPGALADLVIDETGYHVRSADPAEIDANTRAELHARAPLGVEARVLDLLLVREAAAAGHVCVN